MTVVQYIIIAVCLLLAVFLVWKESKRPNRSRLAWRIIVSLLALGSLALLAIPVHYTTSENNTATEAVLLTDGYHIDSVNAFLQQNKNAAVYTKDEYTQKVGMSSRLHVFGYGLSKNEWSTLPAIPIVFHPSVITKGITSIDYKKKIPSGEKLIIQGTVNNSNTKQVHLTLSGFGVGLDSVVINTNRSQAFELSTIPTFIGRAVYDITITEGKDTIEHEELPVQVLAATPLKILLLAAYPDFENKFLQNWLSENNYRVAARTTISKNKYSYSYIDTTKFSLAQITSNVLEQFDVLIADGAGLASLSRQELFTIKEQVNNKGLGLIIKADSTEKPAVFYEGNCTVAASPNHNKQILSIQFSGKDSAGTLPVENVSFIKMSDDARALITDVNSNVLACKALYGNGSLVFSTFGNSYYWALSGDKKMYQLLWSSLIENAARKEPVNSEWSLSPTFPTVNAPVELKASTISEQPLHSTINDNFIAFAARPYLPFEWQGIYWPVTKGWQTVSSPGIEPFWFYVFEKNDWQNIRALQSIQDTYQYALSNKASFTDKARSGSNTGKKMIPAYYWFFVFCCCCIFLWIEKKLS